MTITSKIPVGTNIYDEDWDICIILDACRVDALRILSSEYEFLNDIGVKMSVGSSSKEWMVNTFRYSYKEDINNTVYLPGNGWAKEVLSDNPKFAKWTVTEGVIH
jgi:hypothetical protein